MLKAPRTLSRPSLIVRCQFAGGEFECRVVIDKPISRRRLTGQFLPFLRRVQQRARGRSDFFVLVSDTIYVSEGAKAQFVDLRCDWRDDDEISVHGVMIPDFSIQDATYAEELAAIEKAAARAVIGPRLPEPRKLPRIPAIQAACRCSTLTSSMRD